MKMFTFTGRTPAEAMRSAKLKLGDEILLIENREIRKQENGREALYEVIVALNDDEEQKVKTQIQSAQSKMRPTKESIVQESEDLMFDISSAAKQISEISKLEEPLKKYTPKKMKEKMTPSHDPEEIKKIYSQMGKIGDNIKLIQSMLWDEKQPSLETIIPPEFAEIYKLSAQSGMDRKHLDTLMQLTLEHMPLKMRESSVTIRRYFQTVLRRLIPVRKETPLTFGNKKVMMLVGPTGVGKTTSIAKLAARYSYLLEKKYKVGLVVLDTYRIGAVEQLMQYARMMRLSIETVVDPPEFSQALHSLSHCDYILIDTMGSSPHDREKIQKIYECLHSNDTHYQIDVTLVLPSSIKYEDLKNTYSKFETLGIDTMMFTKLDETMGFGNIFSLVYETKKPISYFSIGQEVPEDLIVAKSEFLVDCLLDGFKKGDK
ncbi:Flagellar biosynthesis protein FlhF [hydrothermal vent metagenome]|uniref:Flagellar biosynthesis protein FlhF n=1 Tax=hydrothermal vent metagenome TaxID=652676 RepID=A0A1W1BJQ9_9ZZZZ